ncbi:hypothetical protein GCM10010360_09900 [Streptomyces nogalater]
MPLVLSREAGGIGRLKLVHGDQVRHWLAEDQALRSFAVVKLSIHIGPQPVCPHHGACGWSPARRVPAFRVARSTFHGV